MLSRQSEIRWIWWTDWTLGASTGVFRRFRLSSTRSLRTRRLHRFAFGPGAGEQDCLVEPASRALEHAQDLAKDTPVRQRKRVLDWRPIVDRFRWKEHDDRPKLTTHCRLLSRQPTLTSPKRSSSSPPQCPNPAAACTTSRCPPRWCLLATARDGEYSRARGFNVRVLSRSG